MTLRELQARLARETIIEAVVDLFLSGEGKHDFTMQDVADRSGVSLRTVYRNFSSKSELIEAVAEAVEARLNQEFGHEGRPETFKQWIESLERLIAFGIINSESMRNLVAFAVSSGEWPGDRDGWFWGLFREAFPHLPEEEARADFAVLRHVLGGSAGVLIGERFGLGAESLSDGVARAVHLLVDGISKRDKAAREGTHE